MFWGLEGPRPCGPAPALDVSAEVEVGGLAAAERSGAAAGPVLLAEERHAVRAELTPSDAVENEVDCAVMEKTRRGLDKNSL